MSEKNTISHNLLFTLLEICVLYRVISAGSGNKNCCGIGTTFTNGWFPSYWEYDASVLNQPSFNGNQIIFNENIIDGPCVVQVLAGHFSSITFTIDEDSWNSFAVSSDGLNWRTPAGFSDTMNTYSTGLSKTVPLERNVTHFAVSSGDADNVCRTFYLHVRSGNKE